MICLFTLLNRGFSRIDSFSRDILRVDRIPHHAFGISKQANRSDHPLSPSKNKHISHGDYTGATADGGHAVDSDAMQAGSSDRNTSSRGCICVVM